MNLRFSSTNRIADRIAPDSDTSIRKLIALHLASLSSEQAPKTRIGREYELGKLSREMGDLDACEIRTHMLASYLNHLDSDHVRKRYRMRFVELFDTAAEEGWRDDNPARILRKYRPKTQRERLTEECFELLHSKAPTWLQNAMDLALQTLQRREDIVNLRWSQITGDTLKIEQGKTGRRLAIRIGTELRDVLLRCRDNIASPFIVHRLPAKARPSPMRASHRSHHTQVLPEQLTRAFSDVMASCNVPLAPGRTHPTFHEIRSLGIALYRQAGWTEEQVQALAGHADVKRTRHYMEGHEAPWQPVESGLQLGRKRY